MSDDHWGDTMPFLKIARHYNLPYELVLKLADYHLHGRRISDEDQNRFGPLLTVRMHLNLTEDVRSVVERYK